MRWEFPTSIYSGFPRSSAKPKYKVATMLDVVRAERRVAVQSRRLQSRIARERWVERIKREALSI